MKGLFQKGILPLAIATAFPGVVLAQDKVEAEVGFDLVSNYIWRGQD